MRHSRTRWRVPHRCPSCQRPVHFIFQLFLFLQYIQYIQKVTSTKCAFSALFAGEFDHIILGDLKNLYPEAVPPCVKIPGLILWECAATIGCRVRWRGAMTYHIVLDEAQVRFLSLSGHFESLPVQGCRV